MKLTPLDIQQQRFPRGIAGYDKKEVQVFLEFVSREVEGLLGEMSHLREQKARNDEDIFRYKEREETLKEALITAQKIAEDMKQQAKKEADLVVAEAEMKADRIIHSAHTRLLSILEEITGLKTQRVKLREELRMVLGTHQKLLQQDEPYERDRPTDKHGDDERVTYLRTPPPATLESTRSMPSSEEMRPLQTALPSREK